MTKYIQNVLEVQNIQLALQFQCHRLPHFQRKIKNELKLVYLLFLFKMAVQIPRQKRPNIFLCDPL